MSHDLSADEPPPYRDPLGLHGVHLLTCHSLWRSRRADESFDLAGIITHIEPPEGRSFPVVIDRVFVYVQLWGDPGEYSLRVRLVRVISRDEDEEEIQLGDGDEPREFPVPLRRTVELTGLNYVDEVGFPIGPVAFGEPGLYEYQLWADGIDEPVARERVFAREWTDDESQHRTERRADSNPTEAERSFHFPRRSTRARQCHRRGTHLVGGVAHPTRSFHFPRRSAGARQCHRRGTDVAQSRTEAESTSSS